VTFRERFAFIEQARTRQWRYAWSRVTDGLPGHWKTPLCTAEISFRSRHVAR
jgi:hypothetical protein